MSASPASAHVEPDLQEVPAGGSVAVDFTIEHGCEGSPTIKVEFKVPRGVTGVVPGKKEGWAGTFADGVVTFTGGSLPDDEEGAFTIGFTAPDTVGQTIRFPMVQTCEQGQLDWIQLGTDDERPAPAVIVGEPDPTATTTTEPGSASTTAVEASTTTSTAAPDDPTTTVAEALVSDTTEDQDSPLAVGGPMIIVGVILMTIGGVYGAAMMRRRKAS